METRIYGTSRKEARCRQIVKEDPSLHPSWLDEETAGRQIRELIMSRSRESPEASPDALPNSPTTED